MYFESKTRGYAAIEKIAETLEGPAVSDCWTAYEKLEQEQQKCLGHLASSVNEVLVAQAKGECPDRESARPRQRQRE